MSDTGGRHPLHPALVHFPIAFWIAAALLDLVQRVGPLPEIPGLDIPALAHLLLWAGVATAMPAGAAGFVDYARLPAPVRDSSALRWHVACMSVAFCLFLSAAVWRVKTGPFAEEAPGPVLLLEAAGSLALLAGGRLASTIVFDVLPRAGRDDGGVAR